MSDEVRKPQSEEEIRKAAAGMRFWIRICTAIYGPLAIAILILTDSTTTRIVVVLSLLSQVVAYPISMRWLNRTTEIGIAEFREEHGLPPASNRPDVGI